MARKTKLRESAVIDSDIITNLELETRLATHITNYHTNPVEALPYYYDSIRGKYLSHQLTRLTFSTNNVTASDEYLYLHPFSTSDVRGFRVQGKSYCLVEIDYGIENTAVGTVFSLRDQNQSFGNLYIYGIGTTPISESYTDTLNVDIASTAEICGYCNTPLQNKPIVTIGLREIYTVI